MGPNFHRALTEPPPKIKRPFTDEETAFIQRAKQSYADRRLQSLEQTDKWLIEAIDNEIVCQGLVDALLKSRKTEIGAIFESMDRLG